MRKLVAALACRAGGSRLYGKPLQHLDIANKVSVLDYMVDWLKTETTVDEIVLGVSVGSENEPFHDIAKKHGIKAIRGDEIDVLQRLIQCCEAAEGSDVFRVTTESPFVLMEIIPEAWKRHCENGNDMTTLDGVPEGSAFSIHTLSGLKKSHEFGEDRHRSELCAQYILEHRDQFKIDVMEPSAEVARLDIRLTIDYPEDLVLCRHIYHHLKEYAPRIPLYQIIQFLDANPQLKDLVKPYVVAERWFQ